MWLLLLPIVALPLLEIWFVLTVSAPLLGWPLTLALLVATSVLGAWLLRREGRAVWLEAVETMRVGRVPYEQFVDGLLVAFGAALMLTPGFISDFMGIVLLIPPTRRPLRRLLIRSIERRALRTVVHTRVID
jgi:UPF0716 protein FxsA